MYKIRFNIFFSLLCFHHRSTLILFLHLGNNNNNKSSITKCTKCMVRIDKRKTKSRYTFHLLSAVTATSSLLYIISLSPVIQFHNIRANYI